MERPWRTRVRLVVARDDGKVLVVGDRLPETEVPGHFWSQGLPRIVTAFAGTGLEPVVLRTLVGAADEAERLSTVALQARLRGHEPQGARWADREEVADAADLLAMAGPARQPWADPDWLPAAEAWLRSAVAATGGRVTGPVQQHKVWVISSVLRAPTTAGDVYLKATVDSPLFVAEASVTALLADLFPRHVPAPLAVEPDRGWLATPDFGGDLGREVDLPTRQAVLRQYATLQRDSVPHVDALVAAGCLDRRPAWLGGQLPHWFAEETTRRWAPTELAERLAAAVPRLVEVCAELGASPLPTTLLHNDMHMGNVARRPDGGYLVFDWTDAGVGHPFVDMIAVGEEEDEKARGLLREAYLEGWADVADRTTLDRDWALSEVLSCANQSVSYMSLGLSLRGNRTGPPHPLFGSYTALWLRRVLDALDRLDGR